MPPMAGQTGRFSISCFIAVGRHKMILTFFERITLGPSQKESFCIFPVPDQLIFYTKRFKKSTDTTGGKQDEKDTGCCRYAE